MWIAWDFDFFFLLNIPFSCLSSLSWTPVNSFTNNNIPQQVFPQLYYPICEEQTFCLFGPGSHKFHFVATHACSGRGIQQQSSLSPTFPYCSWVCQPVSYIPTLFPAPECMDARTKYSLYPLLFFCQWQDLSHYFTASFLKPSDFFLKKSIKTIAISLFYMFMRHHFQKTEAICWLFTC